METKEHFSSNEIVNLFRFGERQTKQALIHADNVGTIPKATRTFRGKVPVRLWSVDQLPAIGAKYGFLAQPKEQHVICVQTGKGGVLKSSVALNLGRTLALNGIKTCLIGLDIQYSLTNYAMPQSRFSSLEDYETSKKKRKGIYDLLFGSKKLKDVIETTDLDTLDVIPETASLSELTLALERASRREYYFQENLIPLLSDYQAVIFDNSPNWNWLCACSLAASAHVVSPISCDLGCYEAMEQNYKNVLKFKRDAKIEWDSHTLIPTLLEKNKLSQQIYATYLSTYGKNVQATPIRRAINGQEALWARQTIFELDPTSTLADDYYEAIKTLWAKILATEAVHGV